MAENWRILSNESIPFADRVEAGRLLADELKNYQTEKTVVLGIPRGGIIAAREIAHQIGGKLDFILAHKIGAPANPELAIGAVVEGGKIFVDPEIEQRLGIDNAYIKEEARHQLDIIHQRSENYRKILPQVPRKGRTVIITDDGAARGLTMQAALWAVRQEHPKKLICALPVAPESAVRVMSKYADEVICLRCPDEFYALGQFYSNFQQVEDQELFQILQQEAQHKSKGKIK